MSASWPKYWSATAGSCSDPRRSERSPRQSQRWPLAAPRRRLFVGIARAQDRGLVEQLADDLQGKRQAAGVETAADRQGRVAANIESGSEG